MEVIQWSWDLMTNMYSTKCLPKERNIIVTYLEALKEILNS